MSIFMGFAIGILIGVFLGAIGMFLLIKETREDMLSERIINEEIEDPWEAEELPMPEEVKHGDL
jgi:hypothetical protein